MATVKGTSGDDTLDFSDGVTNGSDTIYSYGGNDTLRGRGGNDALKGGGGADHLDGGDGIDTAGYGESPQGVSVNLGGFVGGGEAAGDTLVDIENLSGSNYDDSLSGDGGSNTLSGGAGMDNLYGEGGADTLNGGSDGDYLRGGSGADTLNGGSGYDCASYWDASAGVVVSLLAGEGWGGEAEGDQLTGIEQLRGSNHGDTLLGDDSGNFLWGEGGSDTVKGFGGDDYIEGGDDADTLSGWDGEDLIGGGAGDDHISGGTGRDSLVGGDGADTFVWGSTSETYFPIDRDGVVYRSDNMDLIDDFNPAEGDLIDLSGIDADVYASGNQAFTFIGSAAFSGTPGELNYYQSSGGTYIQMQTGTSADIEGVILLPGIHTPQADWFVL
jgi:Ca2+-binding RTX toxin-like protein